MSEQTFKLGEIAIVQNTWAKTAHLKGTECEIIEILATPILINGISLNYRVNCVDGYDYLAASRHLRKKRPPTEYTGELRIKELFNQPPMTSPITQPEEVA